jgi:hypothetical protein
MRVNPDRQTGWILEPRRLLSSPLGYGTMGGGNLLIDSGDSVAIGKKVKR